MNKKKFTQEQEVRVVQLGTRIAEINMMKTKLTLEGKRLNKELADTLTEHGIRILKREGLTIQLRDKYVGIDMEYLKTFDGFKKTKLYAELPSNPYVVVSLRTKKSNMS